MVAILVTTQQWLVEYRSFMHNAHVSVDATQRLFRPNFDIGQDGAQNTNQQNHLKMC